MLIQTTSLYSIVAMTIIVQATSISSPHGMSNSRHRWHDDPLEDNVISPKHTSSPTLSPTIITKRSEVPTTCTMDEAGFYGDQSDGDENDDNVVIIEFQYEVETNRAVIVDDVINNLEVGFAESILPALFQNDCSSLSASSSISKRQRRRLQNNDATTVIGMSTLPEDILLNGVPCQGELQDSNSICVIVDSAFTVYSSSSMTTIDTEAIRTTSLNAIKKANTDGYFVDDDIIKVSIITDDTLKIEQQSLIIEEEAEDVTVVNQRGFVKANNSSISATVYIAAVVIILLLAGIVLIYRRKRQNSNNNNVDAADSSLVTPSLPDAVIKSELV